MSIYDNESRIYPDLNPTATQRPQIYRLKNLTEIEAYLLDEIKFREQIAKKLKQFNTISGIADTGLITSTLITGGISIAAFTSGVGLPVGIALSGTSLLLSLPTAITRKSFKTFTVKQDKYDSIKRLAQSVLSMFLTFHGRTCPLLLLVLLPVFQIAVAQPQSKSFYIKIPTLLPQRH